MYGIQQETASGTLCCAKGTQESFMRKREAERGQVTRTIRKRCVCKKTKTKKTIRFRKVLEKMVSTISFCCGDVNFGISIQGVYFFMRPTVGNSESYTYSKITSGRNTHCVALCAQRWNVFVCHAFVDTCSCRYNTAGSFVAMIWTFC